MVQIKDTVLEFSDNFNGFIDIWVRSFLKVRENHPDDAWLKQNRKFFGSIFPTCYAIRNHTHPRLGIGPGNTVQGMKKLWRKEALELLSDVYGLHAYTIDFSSCHPRIVQYFTNRKDYPFFHDSLDNGIFGPN